MHNFEQINQWLSERYGIGIPVHNFDQLNEVLIRLGLTQPENPVHNFQQLTSLAFPQEGK